MSDKEQADATKADDPKADDQNDDIEQDKSLGESGKAAIKRERDARKLAEKARTDAEAELTTLRQKAADADAAKARADEADAEKKGEFERLATERADKLKAAVAERDELLAKVEAYETRDRTRIETGIKDLPDNLLAFDPGADAPLDQRLKWFQTAEKQAAEQSDPKNNARFPQSPRPNGNGTTKEKQDADTQVRQRWASGYTG